MNFVVGVILIGMVDPQGFGFGDDEKRNIQYAMMYLLCPSVSCRKSQSAIEKCAFSILINLIQLLHMEGLWSSGIPELKRFIFILQKYMQYSCRKGS